ncbi:hypothetical protein SS05631_c17730 [Sinorhizobium sp. CCBAU 05631]|nr:hypothetical protein SS05631_c17730 [Sinorhizobium sp. CCBAU 05631]
MPLFYRMSSVPQDHSQCRTEMIRTSPRAEFGVPKRNNQSNHDNNKAELRTGWRKRD